MDYEGFRTNVYELKLQALAEAVRDDTGEWSRFCFELEAATIIFNLIGASSCAIEEDFLEELDDLLDRYRDVAVRKRCRHLANRALTAAIFLTEPDDVACCVSCRERISPTNILDTFEDEMLAMVHIRNRISFLARHFFALKVAEHRRIVFTGRDILNSAVSLWPGGSWIEALQRLRIAAEDYQLHIPRRLIENTIELASDPRVIQMQTAIEQALQAKAA